MARPNWGRGLAAFGNTVQNYYGNQMQQEREDALYQQRLADQRAIADAAREAEWADWVRQQDYLRANAVPEQVNPLDMPYVGPDMMQPQGPDISGGPMPMTAGSPALDTLASIRGAGIPITNRMAGDYLFDVAMKQKQPTAAPPVIGSVTIPAGLPGAGQVVPFTDPVDLVSAADRLRPVTPPAGTEMVEFTYPKDPSLGPKSGVTEKIPLSQEGAYTRFYYPLGKDKEGPSGSSADVRLRAQEANSLLFPAPAFSRRINPETGNPEEGYFPVAGGLTLAEQGLLGEADYQRLRAESLALMQSNPDLINNPQMALSEAISGINFTPDETAQYLFGGENMGTESIRFENFGDSNPKNDKVVVPDTRALRGDKVYSRGDDSWNELVRKINDLADDGMVGYKAAKPLAEKLGLTLPEYNARIAASNSGSRVAPLVSPPDIKADVGEIVQQPDGSVWRMTASGWSREL